MSGDRLRIALLSYRGNLRSGGQGVYVRQLSRELTALGHDVEVIAGPPYPVLADGVRLTRLRGLDLFAEPNPFRTPALRELHGIPDWVEFAGMRLGGFPEPLVFSLRALAMLARRRREFDIVHDNQCLGYGLLGVPALGLPMLATVHHPVAIDRDLEVTHGAADRRTAILRWYRFVAMQRRVAGRLHRIITPSAAAKSAIPAVNTRRCPNRSPSTEPVISSTAKLNVYAFTVHSSSTKDACRCTRIVLSAVATTSASSTTIRAATAVTARVQRCAGSLLDLAFATTTDPSVTHI